MTKRSGKNVAAALLWILLILAGVCTAAGTVKAEEEGKVAITLKPRKGTLKTRKLLLDEDGVFGKLPVPVRSGYKFKGWYTQGSGGKKIRKTTRVREAGTSVLYAHWKLLKYNITCDLNGGTLPEGKSIPETYTVKTATFRLPSPVREGYVFQGWFTQEKDETEQQVKKIRKGSVGDVQLYARFNPVTITIKFKSNGVLKSSVKKIKVEFGKRVVLPKPSDKAFASWNTSADGSGTSYAGGARIRIKTAKNGAVLTLYANPFIPGNNIRRLYDYFQRIGFTKEASAAIVANLMYESGGGYSDIVLNAVEWSTGRGIGMCQWTNTADMNRRDNFEKYCASKGKPWPNQDLKVQVDFLMEELEGVNYGKVWYFLPAQGYPASYKMTLEEFKKLKNASTAVAVFCANFERPLPQHANLTQRTNYAAYVMNNY